MSEKTEKPLHENHRARMQSRVERDGLDSLAEHEALEYLLFLSIPRQDTNELAHRLIQHFGSFCNVLEADEEELLKVDGVGPKSARLLNSILKYARYYNIKHRKKREALNKPEKAMQYVKPLFYGVQNEVLYLILMDDEYRPIKDVRIGEGIPNSVNFDTRKILREAARTNSTCAFLAHNHPAGIAVPSAADQMTTMILKKSLTQIGITLVDHYIVADEDVCSMLKRGLFPEENL